MRFGTIRALQQQLIIGGQSGFLPMPILATNINKNTLSNSFNQNSLETVAEK